MTERAHVVYARETALDAAEFRRVLVESGLGSARPVEDFARLQSMLSGADLVVTARLDDALHRLVGVARGVSDGCWCCYLSELAVSASAQGLGVGKGLLDEAQRQLGPTVALMLISVPEATGFYERAGMDRVADAFWYRRTQ
jgi:ribosomal protein S18 acetylase RimI-like enzyme